MKLTCLLEAISRSSSALLLNVRRSCGGEATTHEDETILVLVTEFSPGDVYHKRRQEVKPGAVQPLAALLAALQHRLPRGEDGTGHPPRAHGLLGKRRPRLAGFEDKHWKTRNIDINLLRKSGSASSIYLQGFRV